MPIHPTAIVDANARIDLTADIGPFVTIGPHVTIGPRTLVMTHAFIDGHTTIGADNKIYPAAVIGTPPQHLAWAGRPTHTVIGDRNTIREMATIHGSFVEGHQTIIGNDNYFMATAHIAHDCLIGNHVTTANCSLLSGHVEVEDRAFISGHVAVHQFVRVGRLVMCAGVTRVNRDVPPYMMVYGDSEVVGLNLVGLRRAGIGREAVAELKQVFRVLYEERRSLSAAIGVLKSESHGPEVEHVIRFLEGSKRGICGGRRAQGRTAPEAEPKEPVG
jgi:UDP-N-acetylglucosamine acyltransferase